jgi:pyruvate formate lyase activating enzyme
MGEDTPPEKIVENALASNSISIAYTYTEPTIFFEYSLDVARLATDVGISNVYVTNGYMTSEMLEEFHPLLHAANVDLKSFRKETYQKFIGALLQPILDSLKKMKNLGIWIEVTTLVIPGINDSPEELRDIARFIAQELDTSTPWHISRFFPQYKTYSSSPTPIETLQRARQIGYEEGLKYIYLGNTRTDSNTNCPNCGELIIRRDGYFVSLLGFEKGCCKNCGASLHGIWG